MSYSWNHIACSLFRFAFFSVSNMHLKLIDVFLWLVTSLLFSAEKYSPMDHSNGRKQRGNKEPLDEGERGE